MGIDYTGLFLKFLIVKRKRKCNTWLDGTLSHTVCFFCFIDSGFLGGLAFGFLIIYQFCSLISKLESFVNCLELEKEVEELKSKATAGGTDDIIQVIIIVNIALCFIH